MTDYLEAAELSRERNEGLVYEDYHDRMERFRHETEEEPDDYWTEEDDDDGDE